MSDFELQLELLRSRWPNAKKLGGGVRFDNFTAVYLISLCGV